MTTDGGWLPDPTGRHQFRYHDGTTFTDHVADNGVAGVDAQPVPQEPLSTTTGTVPPGSPPQQAAALPNWPAPTGYAPPPLGVPPYGWGAAPPVKPRNGWLIIVGCIAALEAFAIIALAIALVNANANTNATSSSQPIGSTVPFSGSFSQSVGAIVYSSDFATGDNWPTGQLNANTSAAVSNGQYNVQAWTRVHHPLDAPYGVAHPGISVETQVIGYSGNDVSMGTGCQSASGLQPALVYQLAVYPDGQWYIEEGRVPGGVEILSEGTTSALGTTATLQLTCVITTLNSDREVTQLLAYVNGKSVGSIADQIKGQTTSGYVPILLVGSLGPKVQVAFNRFTVRSLSP